MLTNDEEKTNSSESPIDYDEDVVVLDSPESSNQMCPPKFPKPGHICSAIRPPLDYMKTCRIVSNINISCPHCRHRAFKNSANFALHLKAAHKIVNNTPYLTTPSTNHEKTRIGCTCTYFCPIPDCKYNSACCFQGFNNLKCHFLQVHAKREFKCNECQKSFAVESKFKNHE